MAAASVVWEAGANTSRRGAAICSPAAGRRRQDEQPRHGLKASGHGACIPRACCDRHKRVQHSRVHPLQVRQQLRMLRMLALWVRCLDSRQGVCYWGCPRRADSAATARRNSSPSRCPARVASSVLQCSGAQQAWGCRAMRQLPAARQCMHAIHKQTSLLLLTAARQASRAS